LRISLVLPVYNEKRSLAGLAAEIAGVFGKEGLDYDVIFVDDGSTDGSVEAVESLAKNDGRIRLIRMARHSGKTAALRAGFAAAGSPVIVTMDSDLQDDPEDIPRLLNKLSEGYDLVCGWRARRKGVRLRKILSDIFNAVVSFLAGIRLHDINCGIKVFKSDVVKNIKLYSSLHRYIPVLAHARGYKVAEIKVNHRLRKYDRSKYGVGRYFIAFADLFRFLFKK